MIHHWQLGPQLGCLRQQFFLGRRGSFHMTLQQETIRLPFFRLLAGRLPCHTAAEVLWQLDVDDIV